MPETKEPITLTKSECNGYFEAHQLSKLAAEELKKALQTEGASGVYIKSDNGKDDGALVSLSVRTSGISFLLKRPDLVRLEERDGTQITKSPFAPKGIPTQR